MNVRRQGVQRRDSELTAGGGSGAGPDSVHIMAMLPLKSMVPASGVEAESVAQSTT